MPPFYCINILKQCQKTKYIMRILCKIVCILRVYYKYIASILLSNFYSNLRTLTVKIRTIKPRKHRISGVRFYRLAHTLCKHSLCLGFHHFSHFQVLLSPTCRLLFSDNCVLFNLSPVYLPKNGSNSLSNSFFSKAPFLLFSCCYLH